MQKLELSWENDALLRQWASVGYLIHFESLLSTYGNEMAMLNDMDYVVRYLQACSIQVRSKLLAHKERERKRIRMCSSMWVQLEKHGDTYTSITLEAVQTEDDFGIRFIIHLPIARERFELLPRVLYNGALIGVYPVLFTQVYQVLALSLWCGGYGEDGFLIHDVVVGNQ